MCGRFQLTVSWDQLVELYGIDSPAPDGGAPSWSVCPTHTVAIVTRGPDGQRHIEAARWGFPMPWLARQGKDPWSRALINAKAEDAPKKRTWAKPFREGRCVVPATAFVEWIRDGKARHPVQLAPARGPLLHMAGLCAAFERDGEPVTVCAVLTTSPSADVSPVHDRMPALLAEDAVGDWLADDTPLADAAALLGPAPVGWLTRAALPHSINAARRLESPPGDADWALTDHVPPEPS